MHAMNHLECLAVMNCNSRSNEVWQGRRIAFAHADGLSCALALNALEGACCRFTGYSSTQILDQGPSSALTDDLGHAQGIRKVRKPPITKYFNVVALP